MYSLETLSVEGTMQVRVKGTAKRALDGLLEGR